MTAEVLSDALCFLDDDIIEETDALRTKKKNYKSIWIKCLSSAACLCIALVAVIGVVNSDYFYPPYKDILPPTGGYEYTYGSGYAGGDTTLKGAEQTVLVRIAQWNENGFTGNLESEDGTVCSNVAVVEFTEYTRTEKIIDGGTTTLVTPAPTEEDFPVGTVVEVSYENSDWSALDKTVYEALRVRLFESADETSQQRIFE